MGTGSHKNQRKFNKKRRESYKEKLEDARRRLEEITNMPIHGPEQIVEKAILKEEQERLIKHLAKKAAEKSDEHSLREKRPRGSR